MKRLLFLVSMFFLLLIMTTCEKKEASFETEGFQRSIVLGFSQLGAESELFCKKPRMQEYLSS